MPLIMHFTRTPRHENVTMKDIKLIESYFRWQHEKEIKSPYGYGTFNDWCGHSESELPPIEVINYYKPFFAKHTMYADGIGQLENNGLCEQLARFAKANHIVNWFVTNVAGGKKDDKYYEVTKDKLEEFLQTCNELKKHFTYLGKNKYSKQDEYAVDEASAKKLLPLMENVGYFYGPNVYNEFYTECVIMAMKIVDNILKTTDFQKQLIYFNIIW